MNTQLTSNEHFIPKCILKNWKSADVKTKKIGVSTLNLYTYNISHPSLDNSCADTDLYEISKNSIIVPGTENALEKGLQLVETHLGPILNKIKKNQPMSVDDYSYLLYNISTQLYRTPSSLSTIADSLQHNNPKMSNDDATNLAKLMAVPISIIKTDDNIKSLQITTYEILSKKYFYILSIPHVINLHKISFILGKEIPVFIDPTKSMSLYDADIYFPLMPNKCLLFSNTELPQHNNMYLSVTPEIVNYINNILLSLSNNSNVIGISNERLKLIIEGEN